jgi:AcrR family transcriptional regulator
MLLTGTFRIAFTYRSVTLSTGWENFFGESFPVLEGMPLVFGCGEGCGPGKKRAAEKVSETARELFYKRGIRAVGVDEIVTQAGVTKPSLYRSYQSKDDLVASCLREHQAENQARWAEAMAKAPGNPRKQLGHVLEAWGEIAEDAEFRGCPISNAAVEFPDPDHPVHQLAREMKAEFRGRLLSLVSQLDVKDPEGLTDGIILLSEGAATCTQSYGGCTARALVNAAQALIESATSRK